MNVDDAQGYTYCYAHMHTGALNTYSFIGNNLAVYFLQKYLLVGLTRDILILQYAARSAITVLVYIWNSFILEFILTDSFDLKI